MLFFVFTKERIKGRVMLFSSMTFLWIFLPVVVLGTILLRKVKFQNVFLLIASLIFYAWGEPIYVILMLFSIFINWGFGIVIDKYEKIKKICLVFCIAINLLLLGYFKYYNFFVNSINGIFLTNIEVKQIALPIGISFFTFQALSYVIDLYRGNCKVQKNVFDLALYVSFFPQLIAGPIVRYKDIAEQIDERKISFEKFASGMRRFIYGLGKKVIISNCCAEIADTLYASNISEMTSGVAWIAAILYTLQIYYDFSGYSDMAIGLGRIFGFEFLENFNYPYVSRSIHEFWQRWHMSLGGWFKEYVYIPLGGNRKGNLRTYINLITVFFLTGMWHGASWNFIVWGLYHGFFQIVERLGLQKVLKKHVVFSHVYCLLVAVVGWVFFRVENMADGLNVVTRMLMPWKYNWFDIEAILPYFSSRKVIIVVLAIIGAGILQKLGEKFQFIAKKWKFSMVESFYCAVILAYSIMLLVSGTYNPFIYFRF